MEQRKHIWAMLLLIATCLFSNNAFAYEAEINGIYYYFNGDEAIVTYGNTSNNSYTGDVVIPESVVYNAKTYSVTSIGSSAFRECYDLTSVTIGNSVTSIESGAFYKCSGLTSVTIGNSVTSIGRVAFYECSGLTSVTIPNSVTSIGSSAFAYCSGLKKVIVPDIAAWCGIEFADYSANPLYYTKHLYSDETTEITNLIIPNSVTSIGNYAFYKWSGLTSVTIPNSVTSIGGSAFGGCNGLISVTIPNSVTSIGESAFYGCYFAKKSFINNTPLISDSNWGATICEEETTDGLLITDNEVKFCRPWATSVIIPNSVTSIGREAFRNCSGLTSVTIPNSVTSIRPFAFEGCSGLVSITIPNSVTSIEGGAFYGCN